MIHISLPSPESLGELFYLSEVVTALAGELMKVNPFDEPGVVGSKQQTDKVIDSIVKGSIEKESKYVAKKETLELDYGALMRVQNGIT